MDEKENIPVVLSSTDKLTSAYKVLELRLEEFVKRFIKEFEAKLTSYSVILDDVVPKSDKFLNKSQTERVGECVGLVLGGAAGFAIGFPEFGAKTGKDVIGTIAKKAENKLKQNHLQSRITKLSHLINYFEENGYDFRKMLAKVGLDIFQSFEMQFGRVSSDLGERRAMNQLAIDAMNRAIEYIGRIPAESQLDYHSLILEGVKLGKSKGEPILNVSIPGRHKGFEIRYRRQSNEEKWKTASLYSKVGVVVIDKYKKTYFQLKDSKNKTVKYGFRRCFTYENWDEMKQEYTKLDTNESANQFSDYDYFLKPEIVNEKLNEIFVKLQSERDKQLGIDRVYTLLNESKDEILEKLQRLTPLYDKLELESKILSSIEANLKKIKNEKYFYMFHLKMNNILNEISKGNNKTQAKLDQIRFSLSELKNKFENIKQKNNVWFEVRNELLTFTGRKAMLEQIESSLSNGPVVICGLGGIGKSELAVKYARTKYGKLDNVIWINAETSESIAGSIWQLARVLNVKFEINFGLNFIITEIYKIILTKKCLIILDNANNFSDIQMFLKWSNDVTLNHPKIIITSRNSSGWESGRFSTQIIQLEVFNRSEAIEFMKKSLCLKNDSFVSDINKLIDVLGNFPLALQLACTNIKITNSNYEKRNKKFTIENFLEKFEEEPQKLMCGKLPLDMYRQPCSIFIVVAYTFKGLESENIIGRKAQLILKMASYMAPDNIREDFFQDEFDDEDELIAVMNLLENYSLIKINEGKLNIHRLVQQSIRFASEKEEEMILRKNLNLLMKRLKNWDNITFYAPHIISIWDLACNYKNLIEEFIINSSTKFYIYTSFLETLVQRNRIKVVKKIIDQIEHSSNNLIDILKNIFGEKSTHFAIAKPEMVDLLKEHGVQLSHLKRTISVVHSDFSLWNQNKSDTINNAVPIILENGPQNRYKFSAPSQLG